MGRPTKVKLPVATSDGLPRLVEQGSEPRRLDLATVCAGRRLNESAKIVSALDEFDRFDDLRREIAALADDAPYAAWAKGFLSTAPARFIAPGFTIPPAEARKFEEDMANSAAARTARPAPAAPAAAPAPKP